MPKKKIHKWKDKNKNRYYKEGYELGFYKSDIYYRMNILCLTFLQAVNLTPPTRDDCHD
jgi:hypothetical protein